MYTHQAGTVIKIMRAAEEGKKTVSANGKSFMRRPSSVLYIRHRPDIGRLQLWQAVPLTQISKSINLPLENNIKAIC